MSEPLAAITRSGWVRDRDPRAALLTREWLITNGFGGYASGTLINAPTRRYHGLLIAALPGPLGRTMMLNQLSEIVGLPSGREHALIAAERGERLELSAADFLREFRLEQGLPIWEYEIEGYVLEKRLLLAHRQNTIFVRYHLLEGEAPLRLALRPAVHFRLHDARVSTTLTTPYALTALGERFELSAGPPFPPLRLRVLGRDRKFVCQERRETQLTYRLEAERGYDAAGELYSAGQFELTLARDAPVTLIASTEDWEDVNALGPEQAFEYERERRARLLRLADVAEGELSFAELVLAADQFVIVPRGRIAAATRARARGEELRTVIAGYHWFTDWGRDTMISLEGLCLCTGRYEEARFILHTFAQFVRDGLIPNLFPEHAHEGLYHTADASLWYVHAIDRYLAHTGDRDTLRRLLPVVEDIVRHHEHGTRFGIRVDPEDGLLREGAEGYALTWMDAKCDDWVVTPRRGKPVEINALWYNALATLAEWLEHEGRSQDAAELHEKAARTRASFNARYFDASTQHLYDVIDCDGGGDDPALRPNQIFAIALRHAVLERERWPFVFSAVERALLTPVGLRSLAPTHPEYRANYHGDLRTRDAAYHQGTCWSWLIGPFVDAFLKLHPGEIERARALLQGLIAHMAEACVGSISEIFDAEPPFTPRGCIAQAWGVAELLRVWRKTGAPQTG